MATVKYGNGIVRMSGKIAGNVFAQDRFGHRVRSAARRVRNKTPGQLIQRAAFRTCLNYLKANTSSWFVGPWENFAAKTPWTNRIGEQIYLHWRQWFMRINIMRVRNGLDIAADPPE